METNTIIEGKPFFSVLKFHFEQYLEYEISDELFNDILNTLPKCVYAGPAGYSWFFIFTPPPHSLMIVSTISAILTMRRNF